MPALARSHATFCGVHDGRGGRFVLHLALHDASLVVDRGLRRHRSVPLMIIRHIAHHILRLITLLLFEPEAIAWIGA